ncbi:DoxX family protein [Corynebacterium halotolerans]|uniref:DoxX family protein n=1 Tax=Corynebacterium halotolerans TaxID=225326 RepID=UPI003CF15026
MRKLLTATFLGAGVLHFVRPKPFDSIVPPQIPGPARWWTYASGVAELSAATLLIVPRTRRLGGLFSAGLLTAVWPANFYMTWQWRKKVWWKQAGVWLRLPLQLPMIQGAWRIWEDTDRR